MKLRHLLLGRKSMTNLDNVLKKQWYHFANKGLSSQSYDFSSSHVQMWQLDHKETWAQKMLSNCGAEQEAWEYLGLQGDQISQQ